MDVSLPTVRGRAARADAIAQPRMRVRWLVLAGIGIFVLGTFALRLYGVTTRPFWQDEGLTLYQIRLSVPEILRGGIEVQGVMTQNTHPPLYFLLLGLFSRLVGYGQFAVRWFSIAWSVLTLPALYVFGYQLGGRRMALLAALLAAGSPLYLWYAQEVRMYSMVVCLSALSGYLFYRTLTERTGRLFAGYVLATAALMWTHYTALFVVAVQGGIFALTVGMKRPRLLAALAAGLGLAIAPFVPFVWRRLRIGVERDFHFVELDTIAKDLLHSFTNGLSMPIEGIWRFDLMILVVVVIGAVWLWQRMNRRTALIVPALLIVPPLLLFTASFIKPMYQNVRHMIVVSPFFYLLAAAGFTGLSRWRWRAKPAGIMLAGAVLGGWLLLQSAATYNYFTDPRYQKDDTRSMFAYIADHFHPGDLVVLNDAVLSHVLEYEQPQLPWTALPHYGTHANTPEARRQFDDTMQNAQRIWFIYSPGDSLHDPDRRVKQWFRDEGDLLEDQKFHGMTIGLAVAYYDTEPVATETPPAVTEQLGAPLDDGFDLYGVVRHANEVPAGDSLFYDLVWYVYQQPTADYKVSLQLRDRSGQTWATTDKLPFQLIRRTSHWLPVTYLRSPHQLDVPEGTPPGTYGVVATLYDVDSGAVLQRKDGGTAVTLDTVTVTPGPVPAASAWEPARPLSARIGERLQLHGSQFPESVTVGKPFALELFVSTRREAQSLPRVRLELVGEEDTVVASGEHDLLSTNETGTLPAGTLLRSRHTLSISATAPPGTYTLRAVFLGANGAPIDARRWWGLRPAPTATLGTITVEDRPRTFEVPAEVAETTQSIDAGWAEGVSLRRAGMPTEVAAGETVPITLVWHASGPTDRSWKVFVHLVDATGTLHAQVDAYPANGAAPTSSWQTDEVIVDAYEMTVPAEVPAGDYRIAVGFYDETTGERLPRVDGGDTFFLPEPLHIEE